ncbi:MAG: 3-deoxy-D-manno-octulosonic acid transferase [Phycisphaerae bacterium]|nr:3-deoxy-D-manno-octulosonic acid transferase [Phycisphaerae bacterium]
MNILYSVALVLYSPKILYRRLFQNRYRGGWDQRRGFISRRHSDKPCIWIHAVSVGEVNATRTLMEQMAKQMPEYEVVISSTTDTGLVRAKALYTNDYAVFYFPFDFSWMMKRAFRRLNPAMILLMELEVWPNLASLAKEKNIPVVVVNGRLSDHSFPKYQKIRGITKAMFRKVSLVLAQTEEYAERFIDLGCAKDKVIVTSSLKYDTAQTDGGVEGADRLAEQIHFGKEPLWVAGGTGPGEEKMILDAFAMLKKLNGLENLRLAIVPRKPERFDEVAALIDAAGFGFVRYSVLKKDNTETTGKPTVILGDTMGDLKKFYALATVVFVGRTLVPMGGSDMMEPTALGKCTLFGPHTFNFKQTVDALLKGRGAIQVTDEADLYEKTLQCLINPDFASCTAANGQTVIRQNQGATQKTLDAIRRIME